MTLRIYGKKYNREDMNRIVITDSGLGGLSIVASLYEKLKNTSMKAPLDLIFVNALPETGKGYNTMPDLTTKVRIFNNVLTGIEEHFNPDLIAIACNTLSVIADRTDYYRFHKENIIEIINSGIKSLLSNKSQDRSSYIIIFGTETTINMDTHRQLLIESGVPKKYIIPQICPGLASAIEIDPTGKETRQIIDTSVGQAVRNVDSYDIPITYYFACTHYGYVKEIFEESFKKKGFTQCEAFDPNQSMVESLYDRLEIFPSANPDVRSTIQVSIISRCTILDQEIKSIAQILSDFSSDTARKLTQYSIIPHLF